MLGNNAVASFGCDDNPIEYSEPKIGPRKESYELLVVGPEGSGKTLMSRRLKGSVSEYKFAILKY